MGKKSFGICAGILAVALGIMIYLNFGMEPEPEPDVSFPMVNKHITWEGAGYNGIYGRNAE